MREQGLGAANVMARAGAALTPLFAFLQSSLGSSFVPLLVLGCLTLAAAFFTLGLPETLGEAAPATIQDLHLQMSLRRKRHSWRHALAGVASVLRPGGSPPSRTASATLETSAALGSARAMSP